MRDDLEGEMIRKAIAFAREMVELGETRAARRRLKQLETGELITTDVAGEIEDVSPQAVRKRCQEAAEEGCEIGIKLGSQWLVYRSLWLDDIGNRKGAHARLEAESRAENLLQTCADAPKIDE